MQTFREWCRKNGRAGLFDQREPIVTRTEKKPGDLVLGAGYVWERVA